jgi:hypothetical protein
MDIEPSAEGHLFQIQGICVCDVCVCVCVCAWVYMYL